MIIFVESLPLSLLNLLAASLPSIIIVPVHLNSVYTGLCFRSLWLTSWFASILNITLYIFISKFPENISFQHCVTNDLISMVWCIPTTTAIITTMTLIARFMGPTWGPSGADRTQVGPMLAPWNLLSGKNNNSKTTIATASYLWYWWRWRQRRRRRWWWWYWETSYINNKVF